MFNHRPIGVFDSGVGGLSVVRVLRKNFKEEDIIYVGDLKHFPYGTKTEEEVKNRARAITKFLLNKEVKLIIVACNTVSSIAIDDLTELAKPIKVIGMIQAGARYAVNTTRNKKIGVISTPLTAKKHAYKKEIERIDKNIEVYEVGSQELVNLVEDGISYNDYACSLAREKLAPLLRASVDTLVLGCTHFPFLYKVVKNVVGDNVEAIDPADYVVYETQKYLEEVGKNNKIGEITYYTTFDKASFEKKISIFLEEDNASVFEVDI